MRFIFATSFARRSLCILPYILRNVFSIFSSAKFQLRNSKHFLAFPTYFDAKIVLPPEQAGFRSETLSIIAGILLVIILLIKWKCQNAMPFFIRQLHYRRSVREYLCGSTHYSEQWEEHPLGEVLEQLRCASYRVDFGPKIALIFMETKCTLMLADPGWPSSFFCLMAIRFACSTSLRLASATFCNSVSHGSDVRSQVAIHATKSLTFNEKSFIHSPTNLINSLSPFSFAQKIRPTKSETTSVESVSNDGQLTVATVSTLSTLHLLATSQLDNQIVRCTCSNPLILPLVQLTDQIQILEVQCKFAKVSLQFSPKNEILRF